MYLFVPFAVAHLRILLGPLRRQRMQAIPPRTSLQAIPFPLSFYRPAERKEPTRASAALHHRPVIAVLVARLSNPIPSHHPNSVSPPSSSRTLQHHNAPCLVLCSLVLDLANLVAWPTRRRFVLAAPPICPRILYRPAAYHLHTT